MNNRDYLTITYGKTQWSFVIRPSKNVYITINVYALFASFL